MMTGNLQNNKVMSNQDKEVDNSVMNNAYSQASLQQITPISTAVGKSRNNNVTKNIKPSLHGSLSLPVNTGTTNNISNHKHTKAGNNLLTSSDENDSSNNSSASISTSNTPPNELSFNFSTDISKSETYLNRPLQNSNNLLYSPEQQTKLNQGENSRSLSDIFGRRFATGSSTGTPKLIIKKWLLYKTEIFLK